MKYKKQDFETLFIDVSLGRKEWIDNHSSKRICPIKKSFEITGFPLSRDGRLTEEAKNAFERILAESLIDTDRLLKKGIKFNFV